MPKTCAEILDNNPPLGTGPNNYHSREIRGTASVMNVPGNYEETDLAKRPDLKAKIDANAREEIRKV